MSPKVDECSQYKVLDQDQILIIMNYCNVISPCQKELDFGKQEGCKTVSGKEYKAKCQGLGIAEVPQDDGDEMMPGTGSGAMIEIKDDWIVEFCVCKGDNCNNKVLQNPHPNGGNSMKTRGVTGSNVIMMMMVVMGNTLNRRKNDLAYFNGLNCFWRA